MKKLIIPEKQKGVLAIPGAIVIVAIIVVAVALVILLGQQQPKSYTVQINPSKLMPFVSAQETRTTICNLKREKLFTQVCQSKFDVVGKEDVERIAELFVLLDKIQNDKSIPNYERLLLAQAVFAVLPIEDNPETSIYQPTLLSRLRNYLTSKNIAYAQEKAMSDEEFKKMMERDLQNVADSLPKGDNAWVINLMVSKYSWIDGKPQPLYSHQYGEVFDPFPNNPNVNTRDINYHVQSIVGSKASGQTVDVGGPYKGTSEMIAYSFTIMSWNSREYTGEDGPVEEKFLVRRRNFSNSSYQGEHYLATLLDTVKLPSTKRAVEDPDVMESKNDTQTKTPKKITCEEWQDILSNKECDYKTLESDEGKIDKRIWCVSLEKIRSGFDLYTNVPDYTYNFDMNACLETWAKRKSE